MFDSTTYEILKSAVHGQNLHGKCSTVNLSAKIWRQISFQGTILTNMCQDPPSCKILPNWGQLGNSQTSTSTNFVTVLSIIWTIWFQDETAQGFTSHNFSWFAEIWSCPAAMRGENMAFGEEPSAWEETLSRVDIHHKISAGGCRWELCMSKLRRWTSSRKRFSTYFAWSRQGQINTIFWGLEPRHLHAECIGLGTSAAYGGLAVRLEVGQPLGSEWLSADGRFWGPIPQTGFPNWVKWGAQTDWMFGLALQITSRHYKPWICCAYSSNATLL